jgi:hypothetical protein
LIGLTVKELLKADAPLGIRLTGPIMGAISVFGLISFFFYRLSDSIRGMSLEQIENG